MGEVVGAGKGFYRVSRVAYPEPLYTPRTVEGKRLLLHTETFDFGFLLQQAESGIFGISQPAVDGEVTSYSWIQEPYRGRISCSLTGINLGNAPISGAAIDFVFSSETEGTYSGDLFNVLGQQLTMEGSFVMSNL